MLDIYIQYKTNYNFSSTLDIFKYEDNSYEFFYYKNSNKLYICRYTEHGTITHEYRFTELHFNDDDLWEPWAFQQMTVLDIDFDFFREILFEMEKFSDYIELYIKTLPEI